MTHATAIKPLKPPGQQPQAPERDHAKNGFSLYALEQLVRDCEGQPDWRPRADTAHAYYDFKQLSPEQQHRIRRDMGIDPRQTNLIHGVVNGVLGQEAARRTDVKLEADDDALADLCDVFSKSMKEARRESYADMAISNAYAGQVKGGIGWVEVSRASDPLDYPYRVTDIHRNEIWYDWRAKDLGLRDARWLVRKRWQDLDEAVAMLPQYTDLLQRVVNGWDVLSLPDDVENFYYRSYNNERRTTIRRDEWLDSTRRRVKFFEVWYRVPAEVVVMQVSPTRRIVFDAQNPLHQAAAAKGRVQLFKSVTRQVRMALFAGPHRLVDVGTTKRNFPYIPFFAFRDDEDKSPYGLIEGMISPQDEYNERRQMIHWMLRARQIQVDSDALDPEYNNLSDLADEASRPDMMTVMNPSRRNGANALKIGNDLTLQKEQVEVMQDAKQLIQEVPRVYSTQLGNAPAGVTSGVAINSLTDQGMVAMAELNDNYTFGRRMVHEQLLDMMMEDHLMPNMPVQVGTGSYKRTVYLNSVDQQTGMPANVVKDANIKVGLADVPNSPAFRMQEQQQMGTIIQALQNNPQAVAVLTPAYIEGSSLNNRQELADDLRTLAGIPTSQDRVAKQMQQRQAAQQAQQQQAAQAQAQQLQIESAQAQTTKTQAEAEAKAALARKDHAQADLLTVQAHKEMQAPPPGWDKETKDEKTIINEALARAAAT
jgi:hypothetical protein